MDRKTFFHIIIIVFLGLSVYSNSFQVPFVFDDGPNIVDNPVIRDFQHFKEPSKLKNLPMHQTVKNFFPSRYLGYLSFALNYRLHGYSVTGYHVVNLLIHILNALLVYGLLIITAKTPFFSDKPHFRQDDWSLLALFSALFFVCHPLQTQAVTYIVQRFTSFATLWYLLSLTSYIQSRISVSAVERSALYILSLISAIFAMKTKEIAFTLPVVIAMFEFALFSGKLKSRFLYLLPFILTLLIIPLTLINPPFASEPRALGAATGIANHLEISRWDYLFTQFRVIITYLRLFFPPVIQNLDYDYTVYRTFFTPEVFLSFLLILCLLGLAIYLFYRSRRNEPGSPFIRIVSLGIFWFFVTLSVESSIIPISDVIFEHRLYLPSIGFFAAMTAFFFLLKSRLSVNIEKIRGIVISALTALVLLFSGAAYARNTIWQNQVILWADTVKKSPNKSRPHHNLGNAFYQFKKLDSALKEFQVAESIEPEYDGIHLSIGNVYYEQGNFRQAIERYQKALQLEPNSYRAHYNLGNVYKKQGLYDKALEKYRHAVDLKPDYAEAYNNIGDIYFKQGNVDEALNEYHRAVTLKPYYPEAHNNLGNIYFTLGDYEKALHEYRIVSELYPDYIGIYVSIGNVYDKQGRLDDALQQYQTALKYKPDYADALKNRERIKMLMERTN